ncbi:MAG: linear amide C-N hydrolase [Candidatus Krumholzibacteria bacterium]|nr:linear amide C-N hydrolase [Candidatus Krumholzibacteria bacterium]
MRKLLTLLAVFSVVFTIDRGQASVASSTNAEFDAVVDGVDTVSTINSLQKTGDLYTMNYYGDYSDILDDINQSMNGRTRASSENPAWMPSFCTLFSAFSGPDSAYLGRNFDNPHCLVLLTNYDPPAGYASLAFTRMNDLGYGLSTNFDNLTFEAKLNLLRAVYYVPDGINECGLAAGLAYVNPISYTPDTNKETIFVTHLIRKILDGAKNIDEAATIANNYNVFDNRVGTISHHLLVADARGRSAVLEFNQGAFQVKEGSTAWQVLTNIPVHDKPVSSLKALCWRYRTAYDALEAVAGDIDRGEAMGILQNTSQSVTQGGTIWSAVYDLKNQGVYVCLNGVYSNPQYVLLQYVGDPQPVTFTLYQNFPNPFNPTTTISFTLAERTFATLSIYNIEGKLVKTLINDTLEEGFKEIIWDGTNYHGSRVSSGVFLCRLKAGGKVLTRKMVLLR